VTTIFLTMRAQIGQSVGVTRENAKRLLTGNAGRCLCHAIAEVPGFGEVRMPLSFRVGRAGVEQPSASQLLDEVEAVVATGNFARFLAAADASLLALWLQDSTKTCTTPTAEDPPELLAREREVLLPVAEALMDRPDTAWWASPCARADQHFVDLGPGRWTSPPTLPPAASLDAGIAEEDDDERRLREDDRLTWPTPANRGVMGQAAWSVPSTPWSTTRSVPGSVPIPALGLVRWWWDQGHRAERYWRATLTRPARIFEVDSADAWVRLVNAYPRDVTYTRSAWWALTRWPGPWVLPDWAQVRVDFDAVHVTVLGFLEAATSVLPVGEARTGLSMWEPDGTFWLNDVLTLDDPHPWDSGDPRLQLHTDWVIGDDGSVRVDPDYGPLMDMSPGRRVAVADLVRLRIPIAEAIAGLSEFPGSSSGHLRMVVDDVERALDAYEAGTMSAADLAAWAAAVHEREDVNFDGAGGPETWQVVFEAATPELHGPIDAAKVAAWRHLLQPTDPARR
jgi:hypothetical protein